MTKKIQWDDPDYNSCEQCGMHNRPVCETAFCEECNKNTKWVTKVFGLSMSMHCEICDWSYATTKIRPCFMNKDVPRKLFSKFSKCAFRFDKDIPEVGEDLFLKYAARGTDLCGRPRIIIGSINDTKDNP